MSTISCPRCASVFPLAQVAQFDQFTCGACGTVVPVPAARPVALPPYRAPEPQATTPVPPSAVRAAMRAHPAPAPAPAPAARPAQARPAPAPAPAPSRATPAPARPAPAPAPAPVARGPQPARAPQTTAIPARSVQAPRPVPAQPAAAAPAPRRQTPVAPPPAEPLDEQDDGEGRRGRRHEREKKSPMPLVLSAVGAVVLVVGAVIVLNSGKGDAVAPGAAPTSEGPATVKAADPETDAAAWKALPEPDRKNRAAQRMARLDPKLDHAARSEYDFLLARDEKEFALEVAREVARARPDVEWAHTALGHENLTDLYEKCLRENPRADFNSTEGMQELQRVYRESAPKRGVWWGDDDVQKRVKELIAQVYEEEKTLGTPFGEGVAGWVNYRKSIEVMRDLPALHGTVGPYLVFVCLPVPPEKYGKATLADVSPEERKRGEEILARTLDLYRQFYDAWYERFGQAMDLPRFQQENTDREKVLLVNVFANGEDYGRYVAKTGRGFGARAFYSLQEPRFIMTYDGKKIKTPAPANSGAAPAPKEPEEDDPFEDPEQVQCHEGTHQLVHIYTWEATRQAIGRRPEWLACDNRRLWFDEGFAEFCGSYVKEGDKYRFFAPLNERLCDLWTIAEVVRERGWEDWKLKEMLDPLHSGQLDTYAASRVRRPGEQGLASAAMGNLFYAKAWSLNYYLWNREEGGKPKYRDRYLAYMKKQFRVRYTRGADGIDRPILTTAADFRATFGLQADAEYQAFEKDWREWEVQLVQSSKKPEWDKRRTWLRKIWKLDEKTPPKK